MTAAVWNVSTATSRWFGEAGLLGIILVSIALSVESTGGEASGGGAAGVDSCLGAWSRSMESSLRGGAWVSVRRRRGFPLRSTSQESCRWMKGRRQRANQRQPASFSIVRDCRPASPLKRVSTQ